MMQVNSGGEGAKKIPPSGGDDQIEVWYCVFNYLLIVPKWRRRLLMQVNSGEMWAKKIPLAGGMVKLIEE